MHKSFVCIHWCARSCHLGDLVYLPFCFLSLKGHLIEGYICYVNELWNLSQISWLPSHPAPTFAGSIILADHLAPQFFSFLFSNYGTYLLIWVIVIDKLYTCKVHGSVPNICTSLNVLAYQCSKHISAITWWNFFLNE